MERINIAELLKDCPKGMELDCTLFDDVIFEKVTSNGIHIRLNNGELFMLSEMGSCIEFEISKCVIFPKGKTTWEGFVPPCEFMDGDIIFTRVDSLKIGLDTTWISIFKENSAKGVVTYAGITEDGSGYYDNTDVEKGLLCSYNDIVSQSFATEEEKEKLFKAIKEHGYKWNSETKTLEELIVPKFKEGDRVERISTHEVYIIDRITSNGYMFKNEGGCGFVFKDEHLYELIPNKFDITTLKPFESRVLARSDNNNLWKPAIFGFLYEKGAYMVGGVYWGQVIPYENNEHLLGTTNDCDEFYKTWE